MPSALVYWQSRDLALLGGKEAVWQQQNEMTISQFSTSVSFTEVLESDTLQQGWVLKLLQGGQQTRHHTVKTVPMLSTMTLKTQYPEEEHKKSNRHWICFSLNLFLQQQSRWYCLERLSMHGSTQTFCGLTTGKQANDQKSLEVTELEVQQCSPTHQQGPRHCGGSHPKH